MVLASTPVFESFNIVLPCIPRQDFIHDRKEVSQLHRSAVTEEPFSLSVRTIRLGGRLELRVKLITFV